MTTDLKVVVIGGGITGLSTAVCIVERLPYLDVSVITEHITPDTTSDRAGGSIVPRNAKPGENALQLRKWYLDSLQHFKKLWNSEEAAEAGVTFCFGYCDREEIDSSIGFRLVSEEEKTLMKLPEVVRSYCGLYIVDSRLYLPFLMKKFLSAGGRITKAKIHDIDTLLHSCNIVINCTGLGSGELVPDPRMHALWGQAQSRRAPWIKQFLQINCPIFSDSNESPGIDIFPRVNDTYIGGVSIKGKEDYEVDPEQRERISARAESVLPSLKDAPVLDEWVGLRPGRDTIRLELIRIKRDKCIIHNYGHSSNGIAYSWGCALEVVRLVVNENLLKDPSSNL